MLHREQSSIGGRGGTASRACIALLTLIGVLAVAVSSAHAAPVEPLFVFTPEPPPPPAKPVPPPTGYLNDPCGLALDGDGQLYVADHYHDVVDVFSAELEYVSQTVDGDPNRGPCGVAVDSSGHLYVEEYHGGVTGIGASSSPSTGIAVDPGTDHLLVDERSHISEYDASGSLVRQIGSFGDGYGVAVSAFGPTAGYVYVADAATDTVEVYDPATSITSPAETIAGPPGGFVSLRDAAIAVDRVSGDVYVVDDTQPTDSEQPRGRVEVFDYTGAYEGHLRYDVVDGAPTGIVVDNSAGSRYPAGSQGQVFVTSGNTDVGGIYVYAPDAATMESPLAPRIPPVPVGGTQLNPQLPIGSAASPPSGIPCEGDACQVLPPEPEDPTLTTLLQGLGNPKPHYVRHRRNCAPLAREAAKIGRRAGRLRAALRRQRDPAAARRLRHGLAGLEQRGQRAARAVKRCRRANGNLGHSAAAASAEAPPPTGGPGPGTAGPGSSILAPATSPAAAHRAGLATREALSVGALSFDASLRADGAAATQAGSHPYSLRLSAGLDQGAGGLDLRGLRLGLPPGLLLDPAAVNDLCRNAAFATPRSSPYESSRSGESCIDRTQVGTVDVTTTGGDERRFGLFELAPPGGAAFSFGASPFGQPLVFDGQIQSDARGTYFSLAATEVPSALAATSLELVLWGTPWDASHDAERGDCLNEAEPAFAWSKCSVGSPRDLRPTALLSLPTQCGGQLSFEALVSSWQETGAESATAINRDSAGEPAPVRDCSTLDFTPVPSGQLSVTKASSPSGYLFRFVDDDPGFVDPRERMHALARRAVVELPRGVTLNPSLGAGLEACSPAQLAAETAFNPPGAGCPNGSNIGSFSVRVPFYEGLLKGGIYLAKPDEPGGPPGADNPFDSLIAIYLIAKSADRGALITAPGELRADPRDGTITASFDELPQLPYTDLEVNFRAGQRAALISPPACGPAETKITMASWAEGVPSRTVEAASSIESGIDAGPCPSGSLPFAPDAVAGAVNSNVGSYTPYYIHLSRKDTEQEVTSYSLALPKGITAKLAGIPFCSDAAIEAARQNRGFAEAAQSSCPAASEVGHTLIGYGVGPALTYVKGHVYLAGPYHGAPLSLVTVNPATVGPFDLGTIVIRSAFTIDERTAQLRIDSRASDPIPHIRDGIVLHLRDIRLFMDRPEFTHNPSSCEPSEMVSTMTGSGASFEDPGDDSTATATKHFQLLNCLTLGFQPKLGLRLRGRARRGGYPELRASFVSRGAMDSNLKRIEVVMPHALFLAQNHIRTVCTRPQFDSNSCPPGSVYGRAAAFTPLFDEPLRGNVYLRSSSGRFPELVADLRSGTVHIVVGGEIGPSKQGGFRAFFDNLPDAPITRFTMTLLGGRRGLLQNSVNICANPPLASVKGLAQNDLGSIFTSQLRGQCQAKHHQKHRGHRTGTGR